MITGTYSRSSIGNDLKHALAMVVRSEDARQYFEGLIDTKGFLPGNRIVVHYRFCAVMAYCYWFAQTIKETLLVTTYIVYRTVDASPQGGYDWVMHGWRAIRADRIIALFRLAHTLIRGASDEEFDQEQVIGELEPDLRMVQGTPCAVASGRCSLLHKIHALVHSVRMMCVSWLQTILFMNSTFCFCGDLGTESHISQFRGSLTELFGDWIKESDAAVHGEGQDDEDPVPDLEVAPPADCNFDVVDDVAGGVLQDPSDEQILHGDPWIMDLTPSLFISGMLHIIHKATEELGTILYHFQSYLQDLTHVTRLLRRRWSRTRLLQTCFSEGDAALHSHLYSGFSAGVFGGRWGTVMESVSAILPLEMTLRYYWDKTKFQFGNPGDVPPPRDESATDISRVDSAIKSDMFWAYSYAMDVIAEVLDLIAAWSEGCPCHSVPLELRGADRRRKRAHIRRGHKNGCCLGGCRAPELAAGDLDEVVLVMFDKCLADILLHQLVQRLCPSDRLLLVTDVTLARQHIVLFFKMKLSHWRQLPYVLHGVAHFSVLKARRCARRAILLFRDSPPDREHHSLTLQFCRLGSQGRIAMDRFVGGTDLCDLPILEMLAAKCMFVMIVERWIESRHALTQRIVSTAPNSGPVQIAWGVVRLTLEKLLASGELSFLRLCNSFRVMRTPPQVLEFTGLFSHPTMQFVSTQQERTRMTFLHKRGLKHIKQVIFHVDPRSLFRDYSNFNVLPGVPPPFDGPDGSSGGPQRKTFVSLNKDTL